MRNNTWFLVKELAFTDFKLRYNNSVLGYLWSLLNPLLMFAVLYIVFSIFMRFEGVIHYQLYLLLGIILWTYFSEATNNGMQSLQFKSSLISKINFPKWIIIVSSNITSMLTLFLNLIIFTLFFIFSGVKVAWTMPLFLFYLLVLIIFTFSVSLILSAFYLKFRDLMHIWGVILQIGFWMTPIIYPIAMIPENVKQILFLNPMARIIIDSRAVLIYDSIPTLRHNLITVAIVIVFLIIGLLVFKMRSTKFAEEI
jgi:ABC-type polysaccharide/polyol phosphate export permease